jgi:hypothetical protein
MDQREDKTRALLRLAVMIRRWMGVFYDHPQVGYHPNRLTRQKLEVAARASLRTKFDHIDINGPLLIMSPTPPQGPWPSIGCSNDNGYKD